MNSRDNADSIAHKYLVLTPEALDVFLNLRAERKNAACATTVKCYSLL